MSYTAAELNTRITLARFESYRDSDGILHESWTTYAETFAKVEPLVGREYMAAAQVQAEDQVKVTMRYRDDMKPSDRLTMRGEHWDIRSIQNIRWKNREQLLYCKRIA